MLDISAITVFTMLLILPDAVSLSERDAGQSAKAESVAWGRLSGDCIPSAYSGSGHLIHDVAVTSSTKQTVPRVRERSVYREPNSLVVLSWMNHDLPPTLSSASISRTVVLRIYSVVAFSGECVVTVQLFTVQLFTVQLFTVQLFTV